MTRAELDCGQHLSEEAAFARDQRALFVEERTDRAIVTQRYKYIKKDTQPGGGEVQ